MAVHFQSSSAAGGAQALPWVVSLIFLPLLSLALAGSFEGRSSSPEIMVAVISASTHGVFFAIYGGRRQGEGIRLAVGSALALLVLVSGLLSGALRLPWAFGSSIALAWAAAALLMLLLRAMARGMPEAGDPGGNAGVKLTGALLSWVVLSAGFWIISGVGDLSARRLPGLDQLRLAGLLSLLPLLASGAGRRAMSRLPDRHGRGPSVLLVLIGVPAVVAMTLALPGISFLPPGSLALVVLLSVAGLLLLLPRGSGAADMAAALISCGAGALAVTALSGAPLAVQAMAAVPLGAAFAALFLKEKIREQGAPRSPGLPQSRIFTALQERMNLLILRVNFDAGSVHFPFGGGEVLGGNHSLPLTDFLRLAEMKPALDLMQRLQRGEQPADFPMRFRIRRGASGGEGRQASNRQLFSLRVLENRYPQVWLVLERQSQEADQQRERAELSELLLHSALLREERLRIAVARDLRAPVTVLQTELGHLQAGRPVQESLRSLALALRLLSDSLDQLRSGAGTSRGLTGTGTYSITGLLAGLSETFASQARYAGITLRFTPSHQGDQQLHGDHGRVFLALCRLIDNAIAHAQATEITVSGFLNRSQTQGAMVTWLVRDDGIGIDPHRRSSLFEPYGLLSPGSEGEARLGLFAVRRSLRQLGGEVLLEDGAAERDGCCFIVTHPAQVVRSEDLMPSPEEARAMMPERRALLLAEDPVGAEVMVARLKMLFGLAEVVSDRAALPEEVQRRQPDVVFLVDITEAAGYAELVRSLRKIAPDLPLIGIHSPLAPDMRGTLESAGLSRILVKPAGLLQLRDLLIDLFPGGTNPSVSPAEGTQTDPGFADEEVTEDDPFRDPPAARGMG